VFLFLGCLIFGYVFGCCFVFCLVLCLRCGFVLVGCSMWVDVVGLVWGLVCCGVGEFEFRVDVVVWLFVP